MPLLNRTSGRRKVNELTGQSTVPVLETEDGELVHDSKKIVEWAEGHPAGPAAG